MSPWIGAAISLATLATVLAGPLLWYRATSGQLCNPWWKVHRWGAWERMAHPGQPEARPDYFARVCVRDNCQWEQRASVK